MFRLPSRITLTVVLVLATLGWTTGVSHPAHAATVQVTNCSDSGAGTLRDLIDTAAAGETITFACSGTITLGNSGTLHLSQNLTIDGSGQAVTISGGSAWSAFSVDQTLAGAGVSVTLRALTITNGTDVGGLAAITIVPTSMVTVSNCTFSGNHALQNPGAIFNDGTLTISGSTFIGNSSTFSAGAIFNVGTLTISNSTFSGNSSSLDASSGAIDNQGAATISNSTFSGNSGPFAGTAAIQTSGAATTTLTNDILVGNNGSECGGAVTDNGGNFSMRRWRGGRGAVTALVVGVVALAGGAPTGAAGTGMAARETPFQGQAAGLALDSATGVVVVAGGDQNERQVRLLDLHSGAVRRVVTLPGRLWIFSEFGPTSTLLLDQRRARAYVTTYDQTNAYGPQIGYVNVINTRRGALMNSAGAVWLRAPGVDGALTGRPTVRGLPVDMTVDERTGRVFVVNQIQMAMGLRRLGSVTVLDGRTGVVVVDEALSGQTPGAVAVDEATGRAFVIGQRTDRLGNLAGPATLSVLDGTSGRVLSTVALPHGGGQPVVAARLGRLFLLTSSGDRPYTGYVTTINTRTGRVIRAVAIEGAAYCAPVAVDETVGRAYVACADGERGPSGDDTAIVHALDARDGRLLHATAAPGLPKNIVVDSVRGHLFLTLSHDRTGKNDAPGSVAMLDARSGAVLRTAVVGRNPGWALLDGRRGHLFVTADGPRATDWPYWPPKGRGSVSVLDAASGALLDTLPVGLQPGDMALDERAGRLFVLARGGAIPNRASTVKWAERLVPGSLTIVEQTR